jgi:hypothetical protein
VDQRRQRRSGFAPKRSFFRADEPLPYVVGPSLGRTRGWTSSTKMMRPRQRTGLRTERRPCPPCLAHARATHRTAHVAAATSVPGSGHIGASLSQLSDHGCADVAALAGGCEPQERGSLGSPCCRAKMRRHVRLRRRGRPHPCAGALDKSRSSSSQSGPRSQALFMYLGRARSEVDSWRYHIRAEFGRGLHETFLLRVALGPDQPKTLKAGGSGPT